MSIFFAACSSSEKNTESWTPEVTPSLSVPTKNYNIMQKGETIKIAISTNQSDVDVEIPDDSRSWIHLSSKSTQSVSLVIDENSDYETRTASVKIKAGTLSETITLTQQGYVVLNLSQTEYTISDAGGDVYIDTESNFEYEVSIDVDWVEYESNSSRAISKSRIVLNVLPNEEYDSREAKITLRDLSSQYKKTLTIVQAQKNAIVLAKDTCVINKDGGEISFEVGSNVDYEVLKGYWVDWISQKTSRAFSYKKVTFIVSPNKGKSRSGILYFFNKELNIEQQIVIKQKAFYDVSGIKDGHEYVDLGLSVKWATCNVGAETPEDNGDYFAWGETTPQSNNRYYWDSYKWYKDNYNDLTKYCTQARYGKVDNKTSLELADDAARANWGGSWRMPTEKELNELFYHCSCKWELSFFLSGYRFTSEVNGNSIFLPAAGIRRYHSLDAEDEAGSYWSSSLSKSESIFATHHGFNKYRTWYNDEERFHGLSVRAVCP